MQLTVSDKTWTVKILHQQQILEMDVTASRPTDVRRLMKIRYVPCQILSVKQRTVIKLRNKAKNITSKTILT
jgi:hypothetical protein